MRLNRDAVINSNISHFCSPEKFANAHITRINPDKSTFLNSNLLVSNILNHLSPHTQPKTSNESDAYNNCEEEMKKQMVEEMDKKDRINRVRNLAKCRSQTILDQIQDREDQIRRQVQQISVMKIEMGDKARDIMSRKEDTAYLGRNIFLEGEKYLKQMKDYNPAEKVNKIEATRMLMKQRAKAKGRTHLNRQNHTQDASEMSQIQSTNPNNVSTNLSFVDASTDTYQKRLNSLNKEKEKDEKMATMIRNGSYQSVLATQKRHAAWQAFTDHWAQGFKKNDDLITTKKKKRTRKSPKQKCMNIDQNSHLQYNDKMSRHLALKRYKQTFDKTAASFQIISH